MVTHAELINFFLNTSKSSFACFSPLCGRFFLGKDILHPASRVCDSLFPLDVPMISIGKFTLFLARLVERHTSFAVYE